MSIIHPVVHLNGTSREFLLEQYSEAADALRQAIRTLPAPHGRDYYPKGDKVWLEANMQHIERLKKLESVLKDIQEIGEKL